MSFWLSSILQGLIQDTLDEWRRLCLLRRDIGGVWGRRGRQILEKAKALRGGFQRTGPKMMMPMKVGQELGRKQAHEVQEEALAVWGVLALCPFYCPGLCPLES